MIRSICVLGVLIVFLADRDARSMPLELRVKQTKVVNTHDEPVRLRGVNTACMEWSSDGEGHVLETVKTAINDWHVNVIRLPLAQDRWFGKAPEQKDGGQAYRKLVDAVVSMCSQAGCYLIVDLHWSDAGEWGKQIGQHVMPDQNSVEFWKSCASSYKNHPAVIFDLYNELAGWPIHLFQLGTRRHNADLAHENRWQRPGASDHRRIQQLVSTHFAQWPFRGVLILRKGRDRPPRKQGRRFADHVARQQEDRRAGPIIRRAGHNQRPVLVCRRTENRLRDLPVTSAQRQVVTDGQFVLTSIGLRKPAQRWSA
jgi:Cellulase (glycosyl hydrolase family 5)